MRENFDGLVTAVQKAVGRELDPESVKDRTLLHDGCFLLNYWGNEPKYRYEQYLYGPYSMELKQDYIELLENDIPASDTVPQEHVERLARIFSRDEDYLLAYLTVSLILDGNPGISMEKAAKLSLMLEPEVSDQIMEVVSSSMV